MKWNYTTITTIAKTCKNISEFRKTYGGAYKAACRLNIIAEIREFLGTKSNITPTYTEKDLLDTIVKYKTVKAFKKNERSKYEFAIKDTSLWAKLKKSIGKSLICKSLDAFIIECNNVHNSKYDYSLVDYVNSITKVPIICNDHGIFYQSLSIHKLGHGCPSCGKSGFKKSEPGILYYLSVLDGKAYKIGITNNSVQKRFSLDDLSKCRIIKQWKYDDGNECYIKEQEILSTYSEYKYNGDPLLESGNTELFSIDILNLDIKE